MSIPAPPAPPRRRLRDSAAGNVLVIAIATLVILAGVWLVNGAGRSSGQSAPSPSPSGGVSAVNLGGQQKGDPPKIGAKAPNITTFDTEGNEVVLEELRGKPVWLVFGATWCQNCRAENPDIQALHDTYGERVHIIGIYVGETLSTVSDYVERLGLTYRQVADSDSAVGATYRVMGLPTHVFIDAEGVVRAIDVGMVSEQSATGRIEKLLGN